MFLKTAGMIVCAREGEVSTIRFVCAVNNPLYELPRPVTEATQFRAITERREEAPRLAARTEK